MKLIPIILAIFISLNSNYSFAGVTGGGGGTPPAKTVDDILAAGSEIPSVDLSGQTFRDLISKIPSRDLIKVPDGRTLIPLSSDNVRRLKIRASTGIEASVTTDSGEVFKLRKGLGDRLIDNKKLAEVIDKLKLQSAKEPASAESN